MPFGTQQLLPVPHMLRFAVQLAESAVHCALDVQPHAPAVHFGPGLHVAVQLVHAVPPVPHAASSLPEAHAPELQHPPLHAVWFGPRHALPHLCALVSQA